jgi:hypothetical protein
MNEIFEKVLTDRSARGEGKIKIATVTENIFETWE